jgi:hypothetical protein
VSFASLPANIGQICLLIDYAHDTQWAQSQESLEQHILINILLLAIQGYDFEFPFVVG